MNSVTAEGAGTGKVDDGGESSTATDEECSGEAMEAQLQQAMVAQLQQTSLGGLLIRTPTLVAEMVTHPKRKVGEVSILREAQYPVGLVEQGSEAAETSRRDTASLLQ